MFGRLATIWLLLLIAAFAGAEPKFLTTFRDHFHPSAQSDLGKASCQTCHTNPPQRNPFGKLVEAELEHQHKGEVDDAVLDAVAKQTAPDGRTFQQVIDAGQAPATLFPTSSPAEPTASKPAEAPPLIPTHSFHPAIVHFPIALVVFALVLEFAGLRRRDPALTRVAKWALGFGAAGCLASIVTGITAFVRLGFALEGKPLVHLCVALSATTVVLTALFFKIRRLDSTPAYWVLLVLGSGLVMLAGHLGSLMVYP
jgi:uncharacterized membrane protein